MGVSNEQLAELSAGYLATLRAGDRTEALVLVREAMAAGISLCDLYQAILQPALYAIGRLWQIGQLDVASEHLATVITRSVMELSSNKLKPLPSGPPLIIATCVGAELHDIGLRMVSDCLELGGWNTLYLGCNMPLDAIVTLAIRHRVAVVAVSITIGSHARFVRDLISALRQSPIGPSVKILVGGQPFNRIPELWHQIGADGMASDASGAAEWISTRLNR
jgi:MerR family transcriptional regulator, light-induced transcriptional regulator